MNGTLLTLRICNTFTSTDVSHDVPAGGPWTSSLSSLHHAYLYDQSLFSNSTRSYWTVELKVASQRT